MASPTLNTGQLAGCIERDAEAQELAPNLPEKMDVIVLGGGTKWRCSVVQQYRREFDRGQVGRTFITGTARQMRDMRRALLSHRFPAIDEKIIFTRAVNATQSHGNAVRDKLTEMGIPWSWAFLVSTHDWHMLEAQFNLRMDRITNTMPLPCGGGDDVSDQTLSLRASNCMVDMQNAGKHRKNMAVG